MTFRQRLRRAWLAFRDSESVDPQEVVAYQLAEGLRLTREYVGPEVLPALPGWSWWDALNAYDPEYAEMVRSGADYKPQHA